MPVELYPHQQKAVDELANGKILWGGVGTGKSLAAVAYYVKNEAPRDIYVITTAKKRDSLDWDGEFAQYGIGKTSETTVSGVLTVDSWNNIGKYEGVQNGFFIFDEQRLVGAGAWTKAFIRLARRNQWILLSATPGDTWLDYIPVFVANGFYKNRTDFKRTHVVYNTYSKFPKVDRYIGTGKLLNHRSALLVKMPYARHTTRKTTIVKTDYDKKLFEKVANDRWHVFEDRPLKDVGELFRVMRKVVNTADSRKTNMEGLIQKHPKLIVFYNFDYELESLRKLLDESPESLDESLKKPSNPEEFLSDQKRITKSLSENESIGLDQTASPSDKSRIFEKPRKELSSTTNASPKFVPIPQPADTTLLVQDLDQNSDPLSNAYLVEKNSVKKIEPERTTNTTSTTTSGSTFQIAEWNGHKHEPIPTTDRWVYLVQYVAGAESWNCIETDTVVFYSLTYSYKNFHQAHGRIDRLNTPFKELNYYILKSDSLIDKAIWQSLNCKKSFNESDFRQKTEVASL